MGVFFISNGFTCERQGNEIVLRVEGTTHEARMTESAFASVVAHASRRGETGDTYRAAIDFLEAE